jgi:hypothetical protein
VEDISFQFINNHGMVGAAVGPQRSNPWAPLTEPGQRFWVNRPTRILVQRMSRRQDSGRVGGGCSEILQVADFVKEFLLRGLDSGIAK